MRVYGATIDDETRCVHYRTEVDVVAMKFACCGRYYPCHLCHAEEADHEARVWPLSEQSEPAVLCGVCQSEMPIEVYRGVTSCPRCGARFNERCAAHAHLYFEVA